MILINYNDPTAYSVINWLHYLNFDFKSEEINNRMKNNEPITTPTQKWRFGAPQTHLWLIKH
jgi:hypothetical protein